jgi:ABC-type amino acid transport system permease subunit
MTQTLLDLIPGFLSAFLLNLQVGMFALLGGILIGLPLTWLIIRGSLLGKASEYLIAFMRAFPVFVMMFVLLNFFSETLHSLLPTLESLHKITLIAALCTYSASAISDAAKDSWHNFCRSEYAETLLIIPNMFRIFTILVMSSSIGAAIGVKEAVSYTLIHIEIMPDPLDRIMTVFIVTVFFMLFFSTFRFAMYWLVQRITTLNPWRQAS